MKETQEAAQYRRGYPMKQCGVCRMFKMPRDHSGNGTCTKIRGTVNTFGLCDNWYTLNNPWGNKLDGQSRAVMEQIYDQARGGPGQ